MVGNHFLGDVGRLDLAGLDFLGQAADGVHNFDATAIAQRHHQGQAVVLGENGDGFFEVVLHHVGQPPDLADDFQPHVVFVQLGRFGFQVMDEIFHQRVHLLLRPVPIFGGKGVEGQVFDAQLAGVADDGAGGFRPLAVALDAWQPALFGPAAVAIHDHRHVLGQAGAGLGTQLEGGGAHTKMVCSRAGPTEAMNNLASDNSAMALRYARAFGGSSFQDFALSVGVSQPSNST